jgi:antitoxin CptB
MQKAECQASNVQSGDQPALNASCTTLDQKDLGKLKWRARRGLLENDLVMSRYFARHELALTEQDAQGLTNLLDLSDNELMDLILQRTELAADAAPETAQVLQALRKV